MYDPLTAPGPGQGCDHVASYWQATADTVDDDGILMGEAETDVAVIGAGYTGLSAAYHLAHVHRAGVIVLEANRPGWGCSGRNGGFVTPHISRLSSQEWLTRYGIDGARSLFAAGLDSLNTVRRLIHEADIDCEASPPGFLHVAHHANRLPALESRHQLLREIYDFETEMLSANELRQNWFCGAEAFGALRDPVSFGVHPLKLALGLLQLARQCGARVHSATPVTSWRCRDGRYTIDTPGGKIKARHVLIATNGYSSEKLFPQINGRILPVLSSIIVTRPMTAEEKNETGFVTSDLMVDTRIVRPYYRRLPDNRIMFGCRGALRESAHQDKPITAKLLRFLLTKFPALEDITVDFFWSGWVNVTYDYMPRIHRAAPEPGLVYAMGYNGTGVATSIQAGKWSAALLAGNGDDLPNPLNQELKKFPLPLLRRHGQRAMIAWYRLRDAL